jgi:hypothetical protein
VAAPATLEYSAAVDSSVKFHSNAVVALPGLLVPFAAPTAWRPPPVAALQEALLYQFNGASGTIGGGRWGYGGGVLERSCPAEFPNGPAHKPTAVTGPVWESPVAEALRGLCARQGLGAANPLKSY